MKKVAVLLSVYNGQKYIEEQVSSVLAQTGVEIDLFIRDDGSTDTTPTILRELERAHSNIRILIEQNVGVKDSFLSMLRTYPSAADYYAFSDADDVWLPEKLERGISALDGKEGAPALYCSQIHLVDAELQHLGYGAPLFKPLAFSNAIVECRVAGATSVINDAARQVLVRYDYKDAVMHDAWLYLVVAAFGECIYDPESYILYRQHGGNHTGAGVTSSTTWKRRLARAEMSRRYWQQAASFLAQAADDLEDDKRRSLERFVHHRKSPFSRLTFALNPSVHYQRPRSDLVLRLLTITGQS